VSGDIGDNLVKEGPLLDGQRKWKMIVANSELTLFAM
jgi:hypothetical protein